MVLRLTSALVPTLRMHGAIPPLLLTSSWCRALPNYTGTWRMQVLAIGLAFPAVSVPDVEPVCA